MSGGQSLAFALEVKIGAIDHPAQKIENQNSDEEVAIPLHVVVSLLICQGFHGLRGFLMDLQALVANLMVGIVWIALT